MNHKTTNLQNNASTGSFVCFELDDWGFITVNGPDRKTYLHGMVSNEVNKLTANQGNYSLILTAKGKINADLWLFDRGDDVAILTPGGLAESVVKQLDKFLIMEDAVISDQSGQHALIGIAGSEAGESVKQALGAAFVENGRLQAEMNGAPVELYHLSGAVMPPFILSCPAEGKEAVLNALIEHGAVTGNFELYECMRIEAGVPRCGAELDDTVIPQEANLYHAISFEKGCYIGQEVVARLHFRGHVNRELTGFVLEGEPHELPAALISEEKEVGKITSACRSDKLGKTLALGFLRCALRKAGTVCQVDDVGAGTAEVVDLPFTG